MIDTISHNDFIGLYDNVLSQEECNIIIKEFDRIEKDENKKIESSEIHYSNKLIRQDFSIFCSSHAKDLQELIGSRLHNALLIYCDHFFTIQKVSIASFEVKLQRTPPKGGYHVWHCEQDCVPHASRVLVWTIYLNDIPYNEGETEFLWQGIRINPKAGRCVIWPAAFTHQHRGNPVYTHDKYIATGWYTLI